ncbi:MAG: hypothetical protein LW630_04545 [Saprospiraceae bacterium]|jgi:hypothetical protein|nr:hypothetical protein [Saprospiraceae bacterium]
MTLIPYSEEQIFEPLRFENHWWSNGRVEDYYTSMQRRLYFDLFFQLISETEIRISANQPL